MQCGNTAELVGRMATELGRMDDGSNTEEGVAMATATSSI